MQLKEKHFTRDLWHFFGPCFTAKLCLSLVECRMQARADLCEQYLSVCYYFPAAAWEVWPFHVELLENGSIIAFLVPSSSNDIFHKKITWPVRGHCRSAQGDLSCAASGILRAKSRNSAHTSSKKKLCWVQGHEGARHSWHLAALLVRLVYLIWSVLRQKEPFPPPFMLSVKNLQILQFTGWPLVLVITPGQKSLSFQAYIQSSCSAAYVQMRVC